MLITNLAILVLAGAAGYALISKVPTTLHAPLMSGTNAIHGVVIVGALLLLATGTAHGALSDALLVIAVAFGAVNVVGGFLLTDRMLGMFKGRRPASGDEAEPGEAPR